MKPDPEYTRKLLTAFEDAPEPPTDIRELPQAIVNYRKALSTSSASLSSQSAVVSVSSL